MPSISVIIPTYNQEMFIQETLESVLDQRYDDYEIIVVNDGSTDDTINILKRYESPKIKIMNQTNSGLSAARNTGIKSASGEYIGFLDSDDLWHPNMLQDTVAYLNKHPAIDIVIGAWDFIDEKNNSITPITNPPIKKDYLKELIFGNLFPVHAVLLRRKCFDCCGVFDESLTSLEDWDIWLRFSIHGHRIGTINQPIAHYRNYPKSMRHDLNKMESNSLKVLDKIFNDKELPENLKNLQEHAYIMQWLHLAGYCIEMNDFQRRKLYLENAKNLYRNATYQSEVIPRYMSFTHFNKEFLYPFIDSFPLHLKCKVLKNINFYDSFKERERGKYFKSLCLLLTGLIFWPPSILELINDFKKLLMRKEYSNFSMEHNLNGK